MLVLQLRPLLSTLNNLLCIFYEVILLFLLEQVRLVCPMANVNNVHNSGTVQNDVKGGELEHFKRRSNFRHREHLPPRLWTLLESKNLYPDVPHLWLCEGKLLRLLDSNHSGNASIFQVSYVIGCNSPYILFS